MLQKGRIESLEGLYKAKVRIPKYDGVATDTTGLKTKDLSTGIICTLPGTNINYSVGDIVLVGFENDELSKPIILGLLYREAMDTESSTIVIPEISDSIVAVKKDLLKQSVLNTYIKYSNDGGNTFTSLYEYKDLVLSTDERDNKVYYTRNNIDINPLSSTISWSVQDSNGNDCTSDFLIETTLSNIPIDTAYTKELQSISFNDYLITIPANFINLDKLYLSYKILNHIDISDYCVVLTTDKEIYGSIPGEYIGVCVTNSNTQPDSVLDYVWADTITKSKELVDEAYLLLSKRIEDTEKVLYGYVEKEAKRSGLLDGISVQDTCVFVGANKDYIFFDVSKKVYVDTNETRINAPIFSLNRFQIREHYLSEGQSHLGLFIVN